MAKTDQPFKRLITLIGREFAACILNEGHVKVASFGQKTWERRRLACIGAGKMPALPEGFRTLT